MKKAIASIWVLSLVSVSSICAVILTGCAASSLKYTKGEGDPASPPNGGFAFSLHATTVVLSKSAAKANSPAPPSSDAHATPTAPADQSASSTNSYTATCEKPKPPSPVPPNYKPTTDWWRECLRGASSSVVAVSTGPVYVARPDNGLFSKTVATPKVAGSDPLLLGSVTFNTSSTIPGAITGAGTGAAAGFAFGPWGAVIGGIIGAAGSFAPGATGKAAPWAHSGWWDFACDASTEYGRYQLLTDAGNASLAGPVTMDFLSIDNRTVDEISSTTEPKAVPECWRPLPVGSAGGYRPETQSDTQGSASGWFYRFVPNQSPPLHITQVPPLVYNGKDATGKNEVKLTSALQTTDAYFSSAADKGHTTFPVTACRAVDLQITWWQEFDANTKDASHKVALVSFPLTVADPTYVQKVQSPKQGTVTILPVCGGYASAGSPSTDLSDSINNLIKQVQAVQAAESKWATPAKK